MARPILFQTTVCVRCGNKATMWSGYVEHWISKAKFLAGWCGRCVNLLGYRGRYYADVPVERRKL